jgi:AbrB family looped-hinge helix DNA binding protein
MRVVKVSIKGQIVIPAVLRKKYGIRPNSKVVVTDRDGEIILLPFLDNPVKEARGILKGRGSLISSLLKSRQKEKEDEEKMLHS